MKNWEKYSVSVAIPTLNRRELVENTVKEVLASSSGALIEVLVVDQSDEPSSMLLNGEDRRLRYFHVPFKNLPKARNFAIARARGDIILFLDDDVTGLGKIVDAHAAAHARYDVEAVTGPILSPDQGLISADCLQPQVARMLALGRTTNSQVDFVYHPTYAQGANCSYRRDVFARCGGFDEGFFGTAVGEDAEMSHRLRMNFGRIIYAPDASLVHLAAPSGGCRDEPEALRRFEAVIQNTYYMFSRIGEREMIPSVIWGFVRANIWNSSVIVPRNWGRTLRWSFRTVVAIRMARRRTALLLNTRTTSIDALESASRSRSV